jgi:hypothetical protein
VAFARLPRTTVAQDASNDQEGGRWPLRALGRPGWPLVALAAMRYNRPAVRQSPRGPRRRLTRPARAARRGCDRQPRAARDASTPMGSDEKGTPDA